MKTRIVLAAAPCVALLIAAAACSSSNLCVGATCAGASDASGSADGGTDATIANNDGASTSDGGMGEDANVPPGCDASADPKDSLPCVDSSYGAFVSPTGSDSADGTKTHPFQTIAKAIAKGLPRVYICTGTYSENVILDAVSSTELFGGFSCDSWSYGASNVITVSPSTGYPLRIDSTLSALRIEDIVFSAAAGTADSPNSIAAFLANAAKVTFVRDALSAGAGFTGTNGTAGSNYDAGTLSSDPVIAGYAALSSGGGNAHSCSLCADGTTTSGGYGGSGGNVSTAGGDGGPTGGSAGDGIGGLSGVSCGSGGTGHDGQSGADAAAAPIVSSLGVLDAAAWFPSPGLVGSNGAIGQGGGGGAGVNSGTNTSGGGGGGGCGGCGGAAAMGGSGGGACIGIAAVNVDVQMVNCTLTLAGGGKGGNGSLGQPGQHPGNHGTESSPGCPGGNGGSGGAGAASGGGAGGLSVGVLYKTTVPTVDDATKAAAHLGDAGAGGSGGASPANDGPTTPAAMTLSAT